MGHLAHFRLGPADARWVKQGTHRRRRLSMVPVLVAAVASLLVSGPAAGAPSTGPTFSFDGGGWGHGVGMSQWGAMRRAQQGATTAEVLGAYYPGAEVTRRTQPRVRVLLAKTDTTTLQFSSGGRISRSGRSVLDVAAGQTVRLRATSKDIELQVTAPAKKAAVRVAAKDQLTITMNGLVRVSATGRAYKDGRLVVRFNAAGSLSVVNDDLTMQQYLYGLDEVPTSWPSAALEAQAIAARTYAFRRVADPRSSSYDLTATTYDQAFSGADATADPGGSRWIAAVDATDQRILTFRGEPIEALYSASNGGYVTAAGYVFGNDLPYLRDAVDPFDQATGNPNFRWTRSYTGAELGQFVKDQRNVDVGKVTAVAFTGNVSTSGRIDNATVAISGTKRSTTMTGTQFRSVINQSVPTARELPSTLLFFAGTGSLDSATVVPGGARIGGWVALRGSAQGAQARVTVNGEIVATVPAGQPRPDVDQRVQLGPNTGFTADVPLNAGANKVCVDAVMANGAGSTRLGCRDLTAPAPFGAVDTVTAVAGGVKVAGWAIAPSTRAPANVSISVDGVITRVSADAPRPDVAAAYAPYGPQHGFTATIKAARGTHQICVSADSGGRNEPPTRLACRRIDV